MIRIEFFNGQTSTKSKYIKTGGLVTTSHNPCLWTNVEEINKPWRKVYTKAIEYIQDWMEKKINSTELLHSLRYVAYGYNDVGDDKREFNDITVIWPGNLTVLHRPKLVYSNEITGENFTMYFFFDGGEESDPTKNHWAIRIENQTEFYWNL